MRYNLPVAGLFCLAGLLSLPPRAGAAAIERTAAAAEPGYLGWLLAPVDTSRGLKVFAVAALLAMAASALRPAKR